MAVNSLSRSFHWTLCLHSLVLQVLIVVCCGHFLEFLFFPLLCLALCLCVAGAGMQWLHSADLGMNQ